MDVRQKGKIVIMKLVENIRNIINAFDNPELKDLLLIHLNPEAEELSDLFTMHFVHQKSKDKALDSNPLKRINLLTLIILTAPEDMADLLLSFLKLLPPETSLFLLSNHYHRIIQNRPLSSSDREPIVLTPHSLLNFIRYQPDDNYILSILDIIKSLSLEQQLVLIHGDSGTIPPSSKIPTPLHILLKSQNVEIISKIFGIIEQFSAEEISRLLKITYQNETPMELLIKKSNMTAAIMQSLSTKLSLPTLYAEIDARPSLAIQAIDQGNYLATYYYFKSMEELGKISPANLELLIYASQSQSKSIYTLALAILILNAIYQDLKDEKGEELFLSSQEFSRWYRAAVNSPEILAIGWDANRTLLHHAVIKNHSFMIDAFMNRADLSIKDINGQTALELAIEQQCFDLAITMLKHPCMNLMTLVAQSENLLPMIFNTNDYALIKATLEALESKTCLSPPLAVYQSILKLSISTNPSSSSSTNLIINSFDLQPFDLFFKEMNIIDDQLTLPKLFENYCLKNRNWVGLFLIYLAKQINATSSKPFLKDALIFIIYQIRAEEFSKTKSQAQLITLLFSLRDDKRTKLLTMLERKETRSINLIAKLRSIICQAIKLPAIFSRLTTDAHRDLHRFIANPESIIDLTHNYFQSADLSLMSPHTIRLYTETLNGNELERHIGQRISPSLTIILLSRAILSDSNQLARLHAQLDEILELFNSDESNMTNEELFSMLNLIDLEPIKNKVRNYLSNQPSNAPIRRQLNFLFTCYSNHANVLPHSLLNELYFEIAAETEVNSASDYMQARDQYLHHIKPDQLMRLLDKQSQALQPQIRLNALIQTTNNKVGINTQIIDGLMMMNDLGDRLRFKPLCSKAGHISNKLIQHGQLIHRYNQSLHQQLSVFLDSLMALIQTLKQIQDETYLPKWPNQLIVKTRVFQICREETKDLFDQENTLFNLEQIDSLVYVGLSDLINKQSLNLIDAIYATLQIINDNRDADHDHILSLFNQSKPLFLGAGAAAYPNLYSKELKNKINWLCRDTTRSILANPQTNELIPLLINWQLSLGYLAPFDLLINYAAFFLSASSPEIIDQVIADQDRILLLGKNCSRLMKRLRQTIESMDSMNALIRCFMNSSTKTLRQFIELSQITQQEELHRLVEFAYKAKKNPVGIDEKISTLFPVDSNQPLDKTWIHNALSHLEHYLQQLGSLGDLLSGLYIDKRHCLMRLKSLQQRVLTQNRPLQATILHLIFDSHRELLESEPESEALHLLISLLQHTLTYSSTTLKIEIINKFSQALTKQIIIYCIRGLEVEHLAQRERCQFLLQLFSEYTRDSSNLQAIKELLGSQAFVYLNDASLKRMVELVSYNMSNLPDLTLNGAWIQRLLICPQFISRATPGVITQLTECYRALSLTLKQDEYDRLHAFLSKKLQFRSEDKEAWTRLVKAIHNNSSSNEKLYAKLDRLLRFRTDDAIRSLFNQLEENCFLHQSQNKTEADQALSVLYQYYNQQTNSLRSDILFKLTDYIYSQTIQPEGDLVRKNNRLLNWLEQRLPHYNFEQNELRRKEQTKLYNNKGQRVGSINESNMAVQFRDNQVVFLLDLKEFEPGYIFYDKHRTRIGTLAPSGKVHIENIFQHNTSALVVAKIPHQELARSPQACDLLFNDLIRENTLEKIYESNSDEERKDWIGEQLSRYLNNPNAFLASSQTTFIVNNHSITSLLLMLSKSKNKANTHALFIELLRNEDHRKSIVHPDHQAQVSNLIAKAQADKLLSSYLLNFYQETWFADGFRLFADVAQRTNNNSLLCEALDSLEKNKKDKAHLKETHDSILIKLLTYENIPALILNHLIPQQWPFSPNENRLTAFFCKQHILPAITELNAQQSWTNSASYQLLLMILKTRYPFIFPRHELRYSDEFGWHKQDIMTLQQFIVRHLATANKYDPDGAIASRILGELVFRAANYGYLGFFYSTKERIEPRIALGMIQKTIYQQGNTDLFSDACAELMTNWNDQAAEGFAITQNEQLPLITAFLLNYSGPTKPLSKFLDQFLGNGQLVNKPEDLDHLLILIKRIPHREISQVIFQAILRALSQKPLLINAKVYNDLTSFYCCLATAPRLQDKLTFLRFIGQQKSYVFIRACVMLINNSETSPMSRENRKEIKLIDRIARVEGKLSTDLNRWYFTFLQFFKRLWNYGFKNHDDTVRYCDNNESPSNLKTLAEIIETPLPKGQSYDSDLALHEKTSALIKKFDQVMKRTEPCPLPEVKTLAPCRLFSSSKIEVVLSDEDDYDLPNSSMQPDLPLTCSRRGCF